MKRFALIGLMALATLMVVGVAGAANALSLPDPTGDAGSGPGTAADITSVSISSDDSGTLTFRLTIANRPLNLLTDELCINLDLDQNPDTGTVFYGADVALCFERGVLTFERPNSAQTAFVPASSPASLAGTFSSGVVTFTVTAADLGLAPNGGFNFFVETHSYQTGVVDFNDAAPDFRTANYQLVPGTVPPALGPDRRPPFDHALSASGRRGQIIPLRFFTSDGRGQTADTIRVYRRRRLFLMRSYPLSNKDPLQEYYVQLLLPPRLRGPFKFCVSSLDAAGNKSNTSCAPIKLR